MLKISRIGTNYTLDLPEGQTITLELVSMLLGSSEVLQGSYSYPFKFPLNEANRQFIDNGHLPEANVPAELPVLVSEGTFAFQALMGYQTEGKYADAYLLVDLGEIADIIKNQPIREFVSETFLVSTLEDGYGEGPSMRDLAEAEPSFYPIVFAPFLAENFVDESFEPTPSYKRPVLINPCLPGISRTIFLNTIEGAEGGIIHVPLVYLVWLLKYISVKLGFRPLGPALIDDNLKRLVLFNTQAIPGHTGGTYTVHIERHLPFETISGLFSALRDYLGLGVFFNATDKTAYFATYTQLRRVESSIDLSDAYIPGSDKVNRGDWKGYRVFNDIDEGDEKLKGMLDFIRSFKIGERPGEEINLSISTLAMERKFVDESLQNIPPSGGWTDAHPKWFLPSTSHSGTLSNSYFSKHEGVGNYEAAGNYGQYVPGLAPDMRHLDEQSISETVSNRWGMRLIMYYGLQEDTQGRLYPQVSSVSYGARYQTIGSLSLIPGQPDDIFRKYQRYWYEVLAFSKKIEVPLKLSISQAGKLRPEIPIQIRLSHLVSSKYLLERTNIELPSKGGYVRARLNVRQMMPITHGAGWADPDIYGAKWLEVKLENFSAVNGDAKDKMADVVIYVWEDGERLEPFNSLSVIANVGVKRKKLVTAGRFDSTYKEEKLPAGSFNLTEHRNVVFSQVQYFAGQELYEENAWTGNMYLRLETIWEDQYYLQYGEGYRIILD